MVQSEIGGKPRRRIASHRSFHERVIGLFQVVGVSATETLSYREFKDSVPSCLRGSLLCRLIWQAVSSLYLSLLAVKFLKLFDNSLPQCNTSRSIHYGRHDTSVLLGLSTRGQQGVSVVELC